MNRFYRRIAAAAAPFVLGVVTFVAASATAVPAAPHAGDAAPAFTLPSTSGRTVSLAQYKGKPLYLNFFASWCAPCNSEAATVASLYRRYHVRGLATIGVNEQENKNKAAGFAQKYKWPFAIAVDEGNMGHDYGALALPVHVFIDKRGNVSTYRLGEMEASEIEEAIRKIL